MAGNSGRDGRAVCRRSSVDGTCGTARGTCCPCPRARAPRVRGTTRPPDGLPHAATCPAPTEGNAPEPRCPEHLRDRVPQEERGRAYDCPSRTAIRARHPDRALTVTLPGGAEYGHEETTAGGGRRAAGGGRRQPRPRVDPRRVRPLLDNPSANAAVHTPPGARVDVSVAVSGPDTGRRRRAGHPGRGPGAGARPVPPGPQGPQPRPGVSGPGLAVARSRPGRTAAGSGWAPAGGGRRPPPYGSPLDGPGPADG